MSFADNLLKLRKQKGLSQEQLAEMLDVSRQSIYKWESGQSSPELDKLQQMSKLFNCTIDDLVNGEVNFEKTEGLTKAKINREYRKFALGIASGVLFGAIGLATLMFSHDLYDNWYIGLISFFTFGIISLLLFIYYGINFSEFEKELKSAQNIEFYSNEERKNFMHLFSILIILAIGVMILGLLTLIISYSIYDFEGFWPVGVMFILSGIGVFILIYAGIEGDKYNLQAKLTKRESRLSNKINRVIMLIATIFYMLLGFIWDLWHPGWLVFVVGGLLSGIVNVIFNDKKEG